MAKRHVVAVQVVANEIESVAPAGRGVDVGVARETSTAGVGPLAAGEVTTGAKLPAQRFKMRQTLTRQGGRGIVVAGVEQVGDEVQSHLHVLGRCRWRGHGVANLVGDIAQRHGVGAQGVVEGDRDRRGRELS